MPVEGGIKKPHRYRPGTVALREPYYYFYYCYYYYYYYCYFYYYYYYY